MPCVKLSVETSQRESTNTLSDAVTLTTRDLRYVTPDPNLLEGDRRRRLRNLIPKFKMKVRIEREDGGNLLIGGMSLANNCQAILVVFGFFFIFAGVVLTIISYKTPLNSKVAESSTTREQGKICGPIFLVVGSMLFIVGTILSLINWKLHREAKIQRNRFSLESLPLPSRHSSTSAPEDAHSHLFSLFNKGTNKLSRDSTSSATSSFPSSRRESLFPVNYFMGRRRTLPTVSQAVPLGFLIDGKVAGHPLRTCAPTDENQVIENEVNGNSRRPSVASRRKASLSLRASLPIPLLPSPNFMRVRSLTPVDGTYTQSDEPFGSIVSLSGTGDIACFPAQSPRFPANRQNSSNGVLPFFHSRTCEENLGIINGNETMESALPRMMNKRVELELPMITVNDTVDLFPNTRGHPTPPSFGLTSLMSPTSRKIHNVPLKNDEMTSTLMLNPEQPVEIEPKAIVLIDLGLKSNAV